MSALQDLADGMQHMIESANHEKVPFTLLTKYIIRPSIAKEFIGGWLKVNAQLSADIPAHHLMLLQLYRNPVLLHSYLLRSRCNDQNL